MSACRSCAEPVLWVEFAESRRKVPLNTDECPPGDRGAVFVVDGRWAYHLSQLARAIAQREGVPEHRGRELAISRYPAYRAHFATCPDAAQHRRTG